MAGREAALWLTGESITVEYRGQPLPATTSPTGPAERADGPNAGQAVRELYAVPQPSLFKLRTPGEAG